MASLLPCSSFFEQIMAPDFVASDTTNIPADLLNVMPDQDGTYDATDIFGLEFTPKIDEALQTQGGDLSFPNQPSLVEPGATSMKEGDAGNARARHAIFQRSPWLWEPLANQNAFSEHNELPPPNEQPISALASNPPPKAPPSPVQRQSELTLQSGRSLHLLRIPHDESARQSRRSDTLCWKVPRGRGTSNLPQLVRSLCERVRELGSLE